MSRTFIFITICLLSLATGLQIGKEIGYTKGYEAREKFEKRMEVFTCRSDFGLGYRLCVEGMDEEKNKDIHCGEED